MATQTSDVKHLTNRKKFGGTRYLNDRIDIIFILYEIFFFKRNYLKEFNTYLPNRYRKFRKVKGFKKV